MTAASDGSIYLAAYGTGIWKVWIKDLHGSALATTSLTR
jgi:hypothetical protein